MSDTDLQLLARYTGQQAEEAFAELVRRHLDLVFSTALREVRSPQLAEEVAQSAFTDLARQAHRLAPDTILTAWLYQVSRRTAIDVVRREARRQLREQVACELNAMNTPAADWTHIEPLLDEAMHALEETDRTAVLLRYFEHKSLREVSQMLGTNEDAVRKRVSRAVERLRKFFAKRGVTVGANGLVMAVSANAVQAAPGGLAVTISTAAALVGTNIAAPLSASAANALVMTTLQKTLITTTLALAVGTGVYQARQASALRGQIQSLQEQAPVAGQIEQLTQERVQATRQLAGLRDENARLNGSTAELLKLRGELARLRQNNEEFARRRQQSNASSRPESDAAPIGQFTPRADWKDVGTAKPETAAQTFFWALAAGDQDKLGQMTALPDGASAQSANFKAQDMSNAYTEKAKQAFAGFKAFRIMKTEYPTPDRADLTVELQAEGDAVQRMPLTFRRIDGNWHFQPVFLGATGSPVQQ